MNAYMIKSPDAGLLPWTCATNAGLSIELYETATGFPWAICSQSGAELVKVTITETDSPLSAFRGLYGMN